jgi:UDP-N-acetyl-D-galactosamine dehydrogenase
VHEYGVKLEAWDSLPPVQAIVGAVAHSAYREMGLKQLTAKLVPGGVFADVKSVYTADEVTALGFQSWRL